MRYKDWTLTSTPARFRCGKNPGASTRLEFNILEALVRRPRKVFTKRELFEIAWNEESAVEEKAINVHVSNIRSPRAAHSAGEIERYGASASSGRMSGSLCRRAHSTTFLTFSEGL